MDVGVEIPLAGTVAADGASKGGLALGIGGLATATVVGRTSLDTIAINVHVGELAVLALKVDDIVVGRVVAAVREGCTEEKVVNMGWALR